MSFREKSAWLTFILLFVTFCLYFGKLAWEPQSSMHLMSGGHFFLLLIVSVVVLEIVIHILLGIRAPQDAKTPKDERERLVEMSAARSAYYVLAIGLIIVMTTQHISQNLFGSVSGAVHSILFVLWIAEMVRYGTQLFHYRRVA